ncbi:MAG TPA: M56 family metallopeptidase [Candidatus Hydrogenedentes bacterium]|nr:M56 family metallopeptidase [Candidatus Hydrogenedentota bacterium]
MSAIEPLFAHPLLERLGWVLVHFLWQGTVVGVLAAATMPLLARRSANTRYIAACAALLLMAAAPIITFLALPAPRATPEAPKIVVASDNVSMTLTSPPRSAVVAAPTSSAETPTLSSPPHPSADRKTLISTLNLQSISARLERVLPWVVAGWLIGVLALSLRILGGCIQVRRLKRRAIQPAMSTAQDVLEQLVERMRVSRPVQLLESTLVRVPAAIGCLRPAILLPASALIGLSPEQLEAVLAHELAHVRRYDYLVNLLQTVIETLLFYHPAVWWVSHRIRVEREHCCDDVAASICGDPLLYARALSELEQLRHRPPRLAVAAGAGPLLSRIRRLINPSTRHTKPAARWLAGVVTLLILLTCAVAYQLATVAAESPADPSESNEGANPVAQIPEQEPVPAPQESDNAESDGDVQARGQAILREMAEVNRYWLIAPPPEVRNYQYEFIRGGDPPQTFTVNDPSNTKSALRQGITYRAGIHALGALPSNVVVTGLEMGDEIIRLQFSLKEPFRGDCGNGVSGKWLGYFNLGVTDGTLWLDAKKLAPLELRSGILRERFDDYVDMGGGHYAPLSIDISKERPGEKGMHFAWKFRVYDPGLWLFDMSRYAYGDHPDPPIVASIRNVKVNSLDAVNAEHIEASVAVLAESQEARETREALARGQEYMDAVIEANRAWLLPPLEPRRGLVYDYRQEGLYRERVMFDKQGSIMVQLESTKDGPEIPTRQLLYLPDGTKVSSNYGEPYVQESKIEGSGPGSILHRDRKVNDLATGLGLDCALTRMARQPSAFSSKVERGTSSDTYRLVLDSSNGDTKLFTGTMLTFTSWAYMHDVRYARSEIVVDAATHRPLEEKDFDSGGKLVGAYTFSEYVEDPSGAAPGKIEAVIPYEKDGKDQSLEMEATFKFVRPGVWVLERCHSEFRGEMGASNGNVSLVPHSPEQFAPVKGLLARLQDTRDTLAELDAASEGAAHVPFEIGRPMLVWTKAVWSQTAGDPAGAVIAVKAARAEALPADQLRVTLSFLSTTYWKEYETEVRVSLMDVSGQAIAEQSMTTQLRVERSLRPAEVSLVFPGPVNTEAVHQMAVAAVVLQATARHYGHGMWVQRRPSWGDSSDSRADGKRNWGPEQAVGEPDTHEAGDIVTAWASKTPDDQQEWLLVEYSSPVIPTGARIYETYNPGAVFKVSVFDAAGNEIEVWSGQDPTSVNSEKDVSEIAFTTDFKINRVKIYLDSPAVPGWNEIDAVGLVDDAGLIHWAVAADASSTFARGPARPTWRFSRSAETPAPTAGTIDQNPIPAEAPATERSVSNEEPHDEAETNDQTNEEEPAPASQDFVNQPHGVVRNAEGEHGAGGTGREQEDAKTTASSCLSHVDDSAEGRRSIAGSGHAVLFERPEDARFVEAVEIFASRYGYPEPPDEDFHLHLLDEAFEVLADLPYPYGMIERGDMRWYTLETPSVEVPERFYVALAFNPHRTKGIFVGIDEDVEQFHSYVGLPDSGYEPVDGKYDWMVRVRLSEQPSGDKVIHRLSDRSPPKHVDPFEGCIEAKYDNGESDGRQSYGGRGPAMYVDVSDFLPRTISDGIDLAPLFFRPKSLTLKGFRVYGSRYGSGYDPETTTVKVSVLGAAGKILREQNFPYALFSYKEKWVDFALPEPIRVQSNIAVLFDPEAHQTKGIYFHYNQAPPASHSGIAKNGRFLKETPGREWMIRAYFGERVPTEEEESEEKESSAEAAPAWRFRREDDESAVEPFAEAVSGMANGVEGTFRLGVLTVLPLQSVTDGKSIVQQYPRIEFAEEDNRLRGTLHIQFASWPHTKWLMSVDILDADDNILRHAENTHANSGIIERVAQIESATPHFDFDRETVLEKAAKFRFQIESVRTSQGNPVRFDEVIPLELALGTPEYAEAIKAQWIKFKKADDKVRGTALVWLLCWREPKWRLTVRLADADGQLVAEASRCIESRMEVQIGSNVRTRRDIEFLFGDLGAASDASRFEVVLERVPLDTNNE